MNESIRSQFAAANRSTYLNSAAVSPMPRSAIEAINRQLNDVAEYGSLHYEEWIAVKTRARALLASMLNVRAEQIAFTRNTSDGFASIANGLAWKTGDNIVSFTREFPANYYAWRRIRDEYGVELRLCPERDGRIDLDEFINLIDTNTRVATIPMDGEVGNSQYDPVSKHVFANVQTRKQLVVVVLRARRRRYLLAPGGARRIAVTAAVRQERRDAP